MADPEEEFMQLPPEEIKLLSGTERLAYYAARDMAAIRQQGGKHGKLDPDFPA